MDVPKAPIFHPTEEEFANPVKYIDRFAPLARSRASSKLFHRKDGNRPCTEQCFQGDQGKAFPTKKQSVHRLQEGAHYADGKKYYIDDFRAMADKFQNHIFTKMAGHESVWSPRGEAGTEVKKELSRKPDETINSSNAEDGSSAVAAKPSLAQSQKLPIRTVSEGEERNIERTSSTGSASSDSALDASAVDSEQAPSFLEPSLLDLEKEYWRVVETNSQEIDVEYGSDLDTIKFGSGFPVMKKKKVENGDKGTSEASSSQTVTKDSRFVRSNIEIYVISGSATDSHIPCDFANPSYYEKTGWNLNNLPHYPGSVLRHIEGNYNGINVPWLYVGMLFGTFAWHNEATTYTQSHTTMWGHESVVGVPGAQASKLEETLRAFLMERFREVPDLVYHLVTMIGPSILLNKGIDVCKAYQEPGTFIVTFPQAFHGGFSTGFNIGEAVNFALPDWLIHGQVCAGGIDHGQDLLPSHVSASSWPWPATSMT